MSSEQYTLCYTLSVFGVSPISGIVGASKFTAAIIRAQNTFHKPTSFVVIFRDADQPDVLNTGSITKRFLLQIKIPHPTVNQKSCRYEQNRPKFAKYALISSDFQPFLWLFVTMANKTTSGSSILFRFKLLVLSFIKKTYISIGYVADFFRYGKSKFKNYLNELQEFTLAIFR